MLPVLIWFDYTTPCMLFQNDWPEGYQLANAMNFKFPMFSKVPLENIVNGAGSEGMKLLEDMLMWNPNKRPTAQQALRYKHF